MSDQITDSRGAQVAAPAFLRDAEFIELNGKKPAVPRWTTDPSVRFDVEEAEQRLREGRNVGVVLGDDDLVVDVDPRHGGDDSWSRLVRDLRIDASAFPTVRTGSGGLHVYMRLPKGAGRMKNDLGRDGYPGVELKCIGRQVVAPASIHPDTGKPYVVVQDLDPLTEDLGIPEAPKELLELGRRPAAGSIAVSPGTRSPEWLAGALGHLDPTIYRHKHAEWLELMMACHQATGGAAGDEFVTWSISDPEYSEQGEFIGRRWDSLDAGVIGGVTFRTLRKHLVDAGVAHLVEPDPDEAAEDFDDIDPLDEAFLPHTIAPTKAKRQANAMKARKAKAEKGELRKLKMAESREAYATWLNQTFVYDRSTGRRVNIETGESMDDTVFENEHGPGWARSGGKGTLVNAIKTGKAGIDLRSVMMAASFPGRDRFVEINMGTHADVALNTWYDTTLSAEGGDHAWFRTEIERLFPGDDRQQTILLDYWAARCLDPGRKIRWQLVIESAQGVGKGQMKQGFNTLFGWRNCGTFGVTQMLDKFNGWMVSSANLFGEEIGFGTWKEAKDAYENMKAPITDDFIAVRPMQRESQVRVPNGTNYIVNRNAGRKFYCPDDDRRICYLQPCPDDLDQKGAHYQALARHYGSEADMAAVRHWLMNDWAKGRTVMEASGERIAGVGSVLFDEDPPLTDAKRSLMRECLKADSHEALDFGELDKAISDLDLFTADDAMRLARENRLDRFDATDDQLLLAIRKWLKVAGFQKHKRNTNGHGLTLYSPRGDTNWASAGPAERERAYLQRC